MTIEQTRKLFVVAGLFSLSILSARGQNPLTIEEATARTGRDFAAVHEGQNLKVRGIVASRPIWALGEYYAPLRDNTDHGLLLTGTREQFAELQPGETVEAQGILQSRAGLPLLAPSALRKLSDDASPAPKDLTITEVSSLRYVGLLARMRATVTGIDENLGGKVLQVSERGKNLPVFLPRTAGQTGRELYRLHVGSNRVLVDGSGQHPICSGAASYDGGFQLLLSSPDDVEVLDSGKAFRSWPLWTGLAAGVVALILWRVRDRRTGLQRQSLRAFHTLSEEIISAESPTAIAEKLVRVLPAVTRATSVRSVSL